MMIFFFFFQETSDMLEEKGRLDFNHCGHTALDSNVNIFIK